MAREPGAQQSCPLQCRLRHDVNDRHDAESGWPHGDRSSEADRVDWAGLPVNLDLVFSQQQRDKVYAQHLRRKRGTQLWRWTRGAPQACACDLAAAEQSARDSADSMSVR